MEAKNFRLFKIMLFVFLCVTITPWSAISASPSSSERLKKRFEKLVRRSNIDAGHFSFLVSKIDSNEPTYALNEKKLLIPASLTKIATASAIFTHIKKNHRFSTKVVSSQEPTGGVLNAPVYLVGEGDPGFTSEDLWNLLSKLQRTGIRTIQGDIIVDSSYFPPEKYPEGRTKRNGDRAYSAPIGGMSFNWNAVEVAVRPGESGQKAKVSMAPYPGYHLIVNNAKTVSGKRTSIQVTRKNIKNPKGLAREVIHVSGSIGVKAEEKSFYRSISDPAYWSGFNFKAMMAERGIQHIGKIRLGRAPSRGFVLAENEGKPMLEHVRGIMKYSNNFISEMMTQHLAIETQNKFARKPAKFSKGVAVIIKHLMKLGLVKKRDFVLESPSGFSYKNKFTAQSLFVILQHIYKSFQHSFEFVSAFPVAAGDGSLKDRFEDTKGEGRIRAKTGRLNNALGLAGYAEGASQDTLGFVFMYNGPQSNLPKVQDLFDELSLELLSVR